MADITEQKGKKSNFQTRLYPIIALLFIVNSMLRRMPGARVVRERGYLAAPFWNCSKLFYVVNKYIHDLLALLIPIVVVRLSKTRLIHFVM